MPGGLRRPLAMPPNASAVTTRAGQRGQLVEAARQRPPEALGHAACVKVKRAADGKLAPFFVRMHAETPMQFV